MSIYIIAEIGQAHDGSLGMAHSYIDALAPTGVDAVKFQMHIAQAESSKFEPFRVDFSYEDQSRYDYWRRMEFSWSQWRELKRHCAARGIEFLCSPFSNMAVDYLEQLGVQKYKIGSGEVSNFLMLEKIARTGKDIILSSGMSGYNDLDEAIEILTPFGNKLAVLQCAAKYPAEPQDIGLNVITELKARYNLPAGISDHSGTIYPSLAAAALGADILEFHVGFDRRMFGPDSKSSLTIAETGKLVAGVRFIQDSLAGPVDKNDNGEYRELSKMFGKSLAVNKPLTAGELIKFDDLEGKKPLGPGIPAKEYRQVIGKKLNKAKNRWDFLTWEDIGPNIS